MSVKRMITKLALAFAAKKGMEAFRSAGGIKGLSQSLNGHSAANGHQSGMDGRLMGTRGASAGGLGNILGSLGVGGATGGREGGMTGQVSPINQNLGQLFGTLAAALGGGVVADPAHAGADLDRQFETTDIDSAHEARPIVMAMVQMARADGSIDDDEQEALLAFLDDANEDEERLVRDALKEPVDASKIADETPPSARREVFAAALLVGRPENTAERAFLDELATALTLSSQDVNELSHAMGHGRLSV